MSNGGFYNHYDDPDEYWDDEPLQINTPAATVRSPVVPDKPVRPNSSPSTTQEMGTDRGADTNSSKVSPNPYQKSSLVDVAVGGDGLPTKITLNRSWKDAIAPSDYGQSIMNAYNHALYELTARMIESGVLPKSTLPTLREATPLLLRTRTHEQFRDLYNRLFAGGVYILYGPGNNEYGQPALTVSATRSNLVSVTIDQTWAENTDTSFIGQDIVACCDQIRSDKLERIRDAYLDQESDKELAARLAGHEQQLLRNNI